jgi:hypothetical protein
MLKKVEFKPGIILDDTALTAEATYADAQWVRFRRGKWEIIGGWEALTFDTFDGLARGAWSWQDIDGNKILAWGTAEKLYAFIGGEIRDITPNKAEGSLENPFTTVSGSAVVTVEHDQHGLKTGDEVTFSHGAAVGGITISGAYEITVTTDNKYTITHGSNASSPVTGGGYVDYVCPLDAGLVDGTGGAGYGTGPYGEGAYGAVATGDTFARTWSLQNWGENLLACPRGGALFEWQPALEYTDVITNGTFATSDNWSTGTGWSIGSGVATKSAGTASNLVQDIEAVVEGGKTYRITFTVTRSAGTLELGVNAGLVSPAIVDLGFPINVSGTYSRLITMPAEPQDLVFQADSSFAGTVDDVTLTLFDKAYRIDSAPAKSQGMLVASDRIVVMFGTVEADGDYNPLLLRWSDRENNRVWIPASDNASGELGLSAGGRAVAGLSAREQNLFWTDSAVYSLIPDETNVYRLALLGEGAGAIGPMAVTSYSGRVFWLTTQGIAYTLQSSVSDLAISQPVPVESGIQKVLFSSIAPGQADKICAWVNPQYTEVWFVYPDDRDGLEMSRAQVFNWVESHWTVCTINRTTMLSSGIEQYPIGFGDDGLIYYHEKGKSANGGTLTAYVETGDFDLEDGEFLAHVRRLVPDFEGQEGNILVTLYTRPWPQGSRSSHGPYTFATSTQKVDMRATGRQFAVRFDMSGTEIAGRCGALRFDIEKTGQRR